MRAETEAWKGAMSPNMALLCGTLQALVALGCDLISVWGIRARLEPQPGTSCSVIREGFVITAIHHPVSPMATLPIISHGAHRTEHLLLKGPEIWFPAATSLFVTKPCV